MRKETLPDYVLAASGKGYRVKVVNGKNYYLYKRTSKRKPGCKNPQPVDQYIGIITPEGVKKSSVKRLDTSRVLVREYGFSWALQKLCPDRWKYIHTKNWELLLDSIIQDMSPNTYIGIEREIREPNSFREPFAAVKNRLLVQIEKEYSIKREELYSLSSIQRIYIDECTLLTSDISKEQDALLKKIGVALEES